MNLIEAIKYLKEDENNRVIMSSDLYRFTGNNLYKNKSKTYNSDDWHTIHPYNSWMLDGKFEIYKEEKLYSFMECIDIIKNLEGYEVAIFAYDNENAIAGRGNYIRDGRTNYVLTGRFSNDVKENGINFISELYNTTPKKGKGWEFEPSCGHLDLATDAILGKWRRIK